MLQRRATHIILGAFLSGCLLWMGSCAGDHSSGGPVAPREVLTPAAVTTTRYVLNRLDGSPLPRRLCPSGIPTIVEGKVELRSDNRFLAAVRYRTTGSTIYKAEAFGTYTVNGKTVTFRGSNGVTATATLSELGAKLSYLFSYCDPPSQHKFLFLRQ